MQTKNGCLCARLCEVSSVCRAPGAGKVWGAAKLGVQCEAGGQWAREAEVYLRQVRHVSMERCSNTLSSSDWAHPHDVIACMHWCPLGVPQQDWDRELTSTTYADASEDLLCEAGVSTQKLPARASRTFVIPAYIPCGTFLHQPRGTQRTACMHACTWLDIAVQDAAVVAVLQGLHVVINKASTLGRFAGVGVRALSMRMQMLERYTRSASGSQSGRRWCGCGRRRCR